MINFNKFFQETHFYRKIHSKLIMLLSRYFFCKPADQLKVIIFLALTYSASVFPQGEEFGMGLLLDDSLYANSPTAAPLMRGDYIDLPAATSLKLFAPDPGNQGPFGTCAGWSTGYAARTILEALKNNWGQGTIDSNAFSPSYIYNQIRNSKGCYGGTSLISALDVLREQGGVKLKDFGYDCDREVTSLDKAKAFQYRIIEYRDITPKGANKVLTVKKSLAEGRPVVIAMDVPFSFNNAKELWLPLESDYKNWSRGHAMAVIGYDDNKFGGVFEIMNSWGTRWGKNGFTWIKYKDFDFFCKFAFEIIDRRSPDPEKFDLSGSLLFRESNGDSMFVSFKDEHFIMNKPYKSGTLFELIISNNEPAYVYAFSSDLTYKTYKIFPFNERMVAYLPYRQNNVAIPDEESYNMLDETKGTSYFCFFYSKESLDIDRIMKEIENSVGSFWERIKTVLNEKIVDNDNIIYNYDNKINFKAKSKGKTVIPILVEINHI